MISAILTLNYSAVLSLRPEPTGPFRRSQIIRCFCFMKASAACAFQCKSPSITIQHYTIEIANKKQHTFYEKICFRLTKFVSEFLAFDIAFKALPYSAIFITAAKDR